MPRENDMVLYLDTETYSEVDLKTAGTFRYTESCEVMLVTWAIDDGLVNFWDRTNPGEDYKSEDLLKAIDLADDIWIHNAMFDTSALSANGIDIPSHKVRCSMVQALSHGLPGSLGELCNIFKIDEDKAKIADGRRLIMLFCKPRPKNSTLRRATRLTHPDDWQKFIDYAIRDVGAAREVTTKLPRWNYPREPELSLWHLDQVINRRGVLIDGSLVDAALRALDRAKDEIAEETREATSGAVESTRQVQALTDHIFEEYGIHVDDMRKATVTALLDSDIPPGLRNVLELRQQASATSTAKYQAFRRKTSTDGVFRGGIQFAGAARTRRAAGRGVQLQNLPSRGLLPARDVEAGIRLLKIDCADLLYPTMKLCSSAIRQVIVARPGKKFAISDLSNIEGRKVAWYAGEQWKLDAFTEFDAGTGHDLYNLAYARSFRVQVESVTKEQRAIGKVMELMLGYGGGVGAFVTGAAGYGFDIEKLADDIHDTLPGAQRDQAYDFLDWCKSQKRPRHGLTDKAFVTVDTLKRLWRNAHPGTTKLWQDLQTTAETVIRTRKLQTVGMLEFDMRGAWLRIRLPSGRFLCYPHAKAGPEGLSYYGVDQYTRKWQEIRTYSGKLLENICQGSARDVLYDAMPRAEGAGYEIVLHVHDELVAEVDEHGDLSHAGLSKILSAGEPWTKGLPLAAAGHDSLRYCK